VTTIALVPAAGYGTRFHDSGPKALVLLAGRPLLLHALDRLFASGRIDRAVVAVPREFRSRFEAGLKGFPFPVALAEGGMTRKESVASALEAAAPGKDDFVCIHDAARPLIDPVEVAAVVDAAAETGAAIAGFGLIETVKKVDGGRVLETVPREELFAATTPQVFRAHILAEAYAKEGKRDVTDDSELVERTGIPVRVVLTSRWNVKITYPEDLAVAEAFLARREK
jgi:2-C-methyl-D-erythritol 4-phosphate cytidylyltransferase